MHANTCISTYVYNVRAKYIIYVNCSLKSTGNKMAGCRKLVLSIHCVHLSRGYMFFSPSKLITDFHVYISCLQCRKNARFKIVPNETVRSVSRRCICISLDNDCGQAKQT